MNLGHFLLFLLISYVPWFCFSCRRSLTNLPKKGKGKTVFFSSHELGEVETVCDRVAILHKGELKAEGRIADLTRGKENLEQVFLETIGFEAEAAS